MRILFVLPAATIYDRQGRVMGWRATPCSRESLRELKALVPRLQELGPTKVIGSDLDHDSVWLLSRKLRVPYEEWHSLRRLNAGKLHGAPLSTFEEVLSTLPKDKPDVPIKGGDSLTSFQKRVAASKERLRKLDGTTVVVAGEREICAMLGTSAKLERGRVYEWH